MTINPIKRQLDALSIVLLDQAGQEDTKIDDRIDIFKAVATYYLGTTRASQKSKPAGEGDGMPTFKSIMASVQSKPKEDMQ